MVADRASDGQVIGCGALHVMWEDLAEIRTIAVAERCQREGVRQLIVAALLGRGSRAWCAGAAEFLDLDRVKPNTLGNTRMLLYL